MIAVVALFLATAFPSSDKTAWMRPASFHLVIGMPRADAMKALGGWKTKSGKDGQVTVDYADDKTLTLTFEKSRLKSARFELFVRCTTRRASSPTKRRICVPPTASRSG